MSRTWAVVKREFGASVRTKTFIFGTFFGPLLMIGLMVVPMLVAGESGGERSIAVVDGTADGLGRTVAALLPGADAAVPEGAGARRSYHTEVIALEDRDPDAVRAELRRRIEADELDGYLWLPPNLVDDGKALYEGKNATNIGEIAELERVVRQAVRERRLVEAGIDPSRVALALRPVAFEARKLGDKSASGGAESTLILAYILGFAVYMVVILYGQAVMRGVLEEKRDRIVEIVVSSIRAAQLMVGKVLGIGAAGLLQVGVWVAFSALALTKGEAVAARFGQTLPELPHVPLQVGVAFLLFFTGGFFVYSVLYAVVGAIATSDQEAQQMAFPVLAPLLVAIVLMSAVLTDPMGRVAVVGSHIPFTSPVIMPMRAALTEVPVAELAGGMVLLVVTGLVLLWAAAKIYRIGILSTGKRPSMRELVRWLRTA